MNQSLLENIIVDIMKKDSPSGYTHQVTQWIEEFCKQRNLTVQRNQKGNIIVPIKGESSERVIGLTSHVDTLGAMIRSIDEKGMIKFTPIGGPIFGTLDGEYCRIHTRDGQVYTGTFLLDSPAVHVYEDAQKKERNPKNMEVRLDEQVHSDEDVKKLGIQVGDFIAFDTKTQITNSGFVKSRFIDDKGSASCLLYILDQISKKEVTPFFDTIFIFSTYEEVGHGSAHIPSQITDMIAVDMGCIGEDLTCTEYDVSICAKDSGGPYDYDMTSHMIQLSKEKDLSYAVDIYPRYNSDVTACYHGGNDIRGALIGPGVHASHGMERTHMKALEQTIQLISAYLENPLQ